MKFPTTGGSSTTTISGGNLSATTWHDTFPGHYSIHPGDNMTTYSPTFPMTTAALVNSSRAMATSSSWTVDDLKILGVILWFVIVFTLVGNIACFYAVVKNLKVWTVPNSLIFNFLIHQFCQICFLMINKVCVTLRKR